MPIIPKVNENNENHDRKHGAKIKYLKNQRVAI